MKSIIGYNKIVLVILALLGLWLISFQTEPDPSNLTEVLTWVVYAGGAAVVVNSAVSLILENFAFWHGINSQLKYMIVLALTVGVALGANYALQQTGFISILQPYWSIIVLALLGFLSSQITHMKSKSSGYSLEARSRFRK